MALCVPRKTNPGWLIMRQRVTRKKIKPLIWGRKTNGSQDFSADSAAAAARYVRKEMHAKDFMFNRAVLQV